MIPAKIKDKMLEVSQGGRSARPTPTASRC